MTRQEEILEAAKTRAERHQIAEMELYKGDKCNYSYGRIYNSEIVSFEAGVKYADEHPKSPWISINDDLPCNHKDWIIQDGNYFSTRLCVVSDGINIFINKMFNIDGVWKWGEIFEDVKIWFVIPSPCLN